MEGSLLLLVREDLGVDLLLDDDLVLAAGGVLLVLEGQLRAAHCLGLVLVGEVGVGAVRVVLGELLVPRY